MLRGRVVGEVHRCPLLRLALVNVHGLEVNRRGRRCSRRARGNDAQGVGGVLVLRLAGNAPPGTSIGLDGVVLPRTRNSKANNDATAEHNEKMTMNIMLRKMKQMNMLKMPTMVKLMKMQKMTHIIETDENDDNDEHKQND